MTTNVWACELHGWEGTTHCPVCDDDIKRDAVYDAAMDWMGELEALFGGMTFEELEKEMTPCVRTLYLACRRAKEGKDE